MRCGEGDRGRERPGGGGRAGGDDRSILGLGAGVVWGGAAGGGRFGRLESYAWLDSICLGIGGGGIVGRGGGSLPGARESPAQSRGEAGRALWLLAAAGFGGRGRGFACLGQRCECFVPCWRESPNGGGGVSIFGRFAVVNQAVVGHAANGGND
jgi:hypothetical protein